MRAVLYMAALTAIRHEPTLRATYHDQLEKYSRYFRPGSYAAHKWISMGMAMKEWLTRNQGFTARVEGHADEEGTGDYNLALGARRAAAVQEYLIARGVAAGRVSTVSYGRERPLEACDSEACFARNRRAVTVVTPAAGV